MRLRRQAVRIKSSGPGLGGRLLVVAGFAWRPFVIWVLPTAALIAACAVGLDRCRAYVCRSPKYRVAAPKWKIPEPAPKWWEKPFEDQINDAVARADGVSILDETLIRRIAEGYQRCPWVKEVRAVSKHFPNRVDVDIVLRSPAAVVAWRSGRGVSYCLVGDDGVRLPKAYSTWPQPGLSVPFVIGLAGDPPRAGERWADPSLVDAIQIVRLLRSSSVISQAVKITAIDVSNYGGRRNAATSEFLVIAENNCTIEWGRAPGTGRPGELSVQEKLAKFERFLRDGNPVSNRTLGLRFAGPMVVRRSYGADGDNG